MSIKEVRTKILLALLLLSDDSFKELEITGPILHIFSISENRKLKVTINSLLSERKISKSSDFSDSQRYVLTAEGYDELILTFPLFRFITRNWDGKWRILSYEIPESKRELRDKLRREVTQWGLGPWHRSFWITPHPIIPSLNALVSKKEEEHYIQAFEAQHVFGERSVLIEKVWNVSALEKSYRLLFRKWHQMLSEPISELDKMKKVVDEYVDILKIDPGLPKELIGDGWIGMEAIKLFREIRNILLQKRDK